MRRKRSAFSPSSIAGLVAWYDPSDQTSLFQDIAMTIPVTQSGDPVAVMLDKSGNGHHMTQAASASRPVYQTDGTHHWLWADGADDFLTAPPMISDYDFTMLAAVEAMAANGGIVTLHASSSRYWSLHTGAVDANTAYRALDRQGAGTTISVSETVATAPAIVLGQWLANQVSLSVDGSPFVSAATSGTANDAINLRLFSFRGGNHTGGKLHGVAVYDRSLNAGERDALVSAFALKQGRSL
ncbi:hypothetical protein [Aliiroseovarius crassostreae]|uniref:hypothetical protein n=1 Tax=Aliiroseovarius crassostreae TaxID=154981 RepID=UPI0021FEFEF7|nr:hypothetical protein [Aliiroseovarius crassostreae]UWP88874.1 hypothetical protein K3J57_13580 [Aliiroseovarius crassostreae]UWQ07756.1 hypothetical protein K3X25_13615 [Aliiroseovarius crassostreae]